MLFTSNLPSSRVYVYNFYCVCEEFLPGMRCCSPEAPQAWERLRVPRTRRAGSLCLALPGDSVALRLLQDSLPRVEL